MTKAELSKKISKETGLQIKDVTLILEEFFSTVKEQIIKGERITIRGFGTFKMKHRAEKKAQNITKGTAVIIPAKDIPSFKASKQFFEEI